MSNAAPRPAKRARRTQADRREESERALLEAAIALVVESGVGALTFDAIGQKAGFSRGLAGLRFGSKQGLIEAVILYLVAQTDATNQKIPVEEMSGLDVIFSSVRLGIDDLKRAAQGETRAYFMLLAAAVGAGSSELEVFAVQHAHAKSRLEGLVRKGQSDGSIRADADPPAVALMVATLLLGVSLQFIVDPSMDLDSLRETILATLRASLAPAP